MVSAHKCRVNPCFLPRLKTNIIQNVRTNAGNFRTHARNLYQSGNFQTHAVNFLTHAGNFELSGIFCVIGKKKNIFMSNPNFRTHAGYIQTHAGNV